MKWSDKPTVASQKFPCYKLFCILSATKLYVKVVYVILYIDQWLFQEITIEDRYISNLRTFYSTELLPESLASNKASYSAGSEWDLPSALCPSSLSSSPRALMDSGWNLPRKASMAQTLGTALLVDYHLMH